MCCWVYMHAHVCVCVCVTYSCSTLSLRTPLKLNWQRMSLRMILSVPVRMPTTQLSVSHRMPTMPTAQCSVSHRMPTAQLSVSHRMKVLCHAIIFMTLKRSGPSAFHIQMNPSWSPATCSSWCNGMQCFSVLCDVKVCCVMLWCAVCCKGVLLRCAV